MPLYDYKCGVCGKTDIDHMKKISAPAPICCSTPMVQMLGLPMLDNFKPQFFEHLAPEPMFFESKRQLRRYCRDNNLTMDYVE